MNCPELGPAIVVSGNRFRVIGQETNDGLFSWFDATDPDVISQVLRLERAERVLGGMIGGVYGNRVAAELRAAGLLQAEPLPIDDYVDELKRLKKEAGIVDL